MNNKNNEIQNKIKELENSKIDKLKLIKKTIKDSLNYN